MEDGNFKLSTKFLEHDSATSSSTDQNERHPSSRPDSKFYLYNASSLNTTGGFGSLNMGHLLPLLGRSKPFFAPNADISVSQDLAVPQAQKLVFDSNSCVLSPLK